MLEQRVRESKDDGIANIEYITRAGKPVDEIVNESENRNYDLVVMASSRITSKVRVLGSNVRHVLDSIRRPVLVIHE
jgi:nucleotide-binding universal stress UspA family protein